jgi:hypothetical protein
MIDLHREEGKNIPGEPKKIPGKPQKISKEREKNQSQYHYTSILDV